jgi:predicted ferric reductase
MRSQIWWYAARAGGIVSWALLVASMLWGLALTSKALGGRPRPAWLLDLHRWLGALALVFTGVHVIAVVADSYVHFGLAEVLVPFASAWHPVAVAWGVVAGYLLLAVQLTSVVRKRLPKALWRRVHFVSFPLFVAATIHGLAAGTDTRTLLSVVVTAAAFVAVTALIGVRLDRRPLRASKPTEVDHVLVSR